MKRSILIFSTEQLVADEKLEELLNDTQVVRRTKDVAETETNHYRARRWSENQRACKAHEIYIDTNLNSESVNTSIIPCLIREFDEDWNWREHIHYF
ncbi:hypothetical protein [Paenibacillus polymyxa]|uniref:hypothetical protein n=1 Tax=Paenibacillus polymyxa TaxID=1406 RepID=UPI002AB4D29A|nr:hypothetical protein [Paenibacillus polymyxa]MDY8021113.1 hypothetical protein [Paenibacillus polymyxa]